jgi:hypothetical protein
MKNSIISLSLFLIFIFLEQATALQDSTTIVFKYSKDKELKMLYDLLDVQYIGIECPDTNLHGKKFYLSCDEYIKGKIVKTEDFGLKSKADTIPMVTGTGETSFYIMDYSEHIIFDDSYKSFAIDFMSKFQNDTISLKINFPGIHMTQKLACDNQFLLRAVNPCGTSDTISIPLNKPYPVVAFTPPFKLANMGGNYCMLATKDINEWYPEFKIEHFYVFNIVIK